MLPTPLPLASVPTRVECVPSLSTRKTTLWVKREDQSGELYGGNKVRKLAYLLAEARALGKQRLVTVGAAGSHHVLATALYGAREGFQVEAVLVPQPFSEHATANLRSGLAAGLRVSAATNWASAAAQIAWAVAKGAHYIPVGGSNWVGALGYVDAARELSLQVETGAMPSPDILVVPLGSGGTAAGLAVGLEGAGRSTRVIGIVVATPVRAVHWTTTRLAKSVAWRTGHQAQGHAAKAFRGNWLESRLEFDTSELGDGYAKPTDAARRALQTAEDVGLHLDTTYSAKAFAAALRAVESGRYRTVLFVNTLSSVLRDPVEACPALSEPLRALFR